MKRTIAAFIILLLLFTGSILHTRTLNRLTEDIGQSIRESKQAYQQGGITLAETALQKAFEQWQSHQAYLYIFFSHDRIETLNSSFYDLLSNLNNDPPVSTLLDYERLLQLMRQLNRDEQLRLESVF